MCEVNCTSHLGPAPAAKAGLPLPGGAVCTNRDPWHLAAAQSPLPGGCLEHSRLRGYGGVTLSHRPARRAPRRMPAGRIAGGAAEPPPLSLSHSLGADAVSDKQPGNAEGALCTTMQNGSTPTTQLTTRVGYHKVGIPLLSLSPLRSNHRLGRGGWEL